MCTWRITSHTASARSSPLALFPRLRAAAPLAAQMASEQPRNSTAPLASPWMLAEPRAMVWIRETALSAALCFLRRLFPRWLAAALGALLTAWAFWRSSMDRRAPRGTLAAHSLLRMGGVGAWAAATTASDASLLPPRQSPPSRGTGPRGAPMGRGRRQLSTNPAGSLLTQHFRRSSCPTCLEIGSEQLIWPPPLCAPSPARARLGSATGLGLPPCSMGPVSLPPPLQGSSTLRMPTTTACARSPACPAPPPTTAPRARPCCALRAPFARYPP